MSPEIAALISGMAFTWMNFTAFNLRRKEWT